MRTLVQLTVGQHWPSLGELLFPSRRRVTRLLDPRDLSDHLLCDIGLRDTHLTASRGR